jgi:hypothetical protein
VSAARVKGGRRGVISVPLRLEPVAHCRIVDQLRKLADLPESGFLLAADARLWAHAGAAIMPSGSGMPHRVAPV